MQTGGKWKGHLLTESSTYIGFRLGNILDCLRVINARYRGVDSRACTFKTKVLGREVSPSYERWCSTTLQPSELIRVVHDESSNHVETGIATSTPSCHGGCRVPQHASKPVRWGHNTQIIWRCKAQCRQGENGKDICSPKALLTLAFASEIFWIVFESSKQDIEESIPEHAHSRQTCWGGRRLHHTKDGVVRLFSQANSSEWCMTKLESHGNWDRNKHAIMPWRVSCSTTRKQACQMGA